MGKELDPNAADILGWADGDVSNIYNIWQLCRVSLGSDDPHLIATTGCAYAVYLVTAGLMVPGRVSRHDGRLRFDVWDGDVDVWVPRLAAMWGAIGSESDIEGKICDLLLTPAGEEVVDGFRPS